MELINNLFTELGIVWANNVGLILLKNYTRNITEKPKFSFEFHSLYCEPTLCHKVIDGFDYELTDDEKIEVLSYLQLENELPELVNGVDNTGKYHEGVTKDKVVRIVSSSPPKGIWRLDMSISPDENWFQPLCIGKDGFKIDTNTENEVDIILPANTTEPITNWGEIWKWDKEKSKWVDSRSNKEILEHIKNDQLEHAHFYALNIIQSMTIDWNDKHFNIDDETKNNLKDTIDSLEKETDNVDWFAKGETTPIVLTKSIAKELLQAILTERSRIMNIYFKHKRNIKELKSIEKAKKYDITKNY